jgi:hypothetical protein
MVAMFMLIETAKPYGMGSLDWLADVFLWLR